MPSPTLDLRFGVVVNGQRSYTWHVRSGANKPELFVDRENLPHKVHLSLHKSGDWHMKVGRRAVHEWRRPAELTPGYTRALAIMQPVAVAMFALPAPADAHILKLPADGQPTQFDLWIERLGANLQGWPGKNADGTLLVGRIPLAIGAGTCCVVTRQAPMGPVSFTSADRPTDRQRTWMQDRATEGRLYHTLIGELSDGTVVLLDGRFDPTNVGGGGRSTLTFN